MKITLWDTVLDVGGYSATAAFARARSDVEEAIAGVRWPVGGPDFAIYPESGKARGAGNGVVPIKKGFADAIEPLGWELEKRAPAARNDQDAVVKGSRPGAFDAHLTFDGNDPLPFAAEWETGNISSSHRAINRIGLGIKLGYLSGGVLILPSNPLAKYLTDRIGNASELGPYRSLWSDWELAPLAYFGIVVVEHDRTSFDVPRIGKGKDGRATD